MTQWITRSLLATAAVVLPLMPPASAVASAPDQDAAAVLDEQLPEARILGFSRDSFMTLHPLAPADAKGQVRYMRSDVFLPGSKIVDGPNGLRQEISWIDVAGSLNCTDRILTTHHATAYTPAGRAISTSRYDTSRPLQTTDMEVAMANYLCRGQKVEGAQLVPASRAARIKAIQLLLMRRAATKPESTP